MSRCMDPIETWGIFHDFPASHVSELRGVTFVLMGRALDPVETHNFVILDTRAI